MRKKLFALALLMFIFAFQFSTSGELALFAKAYEYRFDYWTDTTILNWGKFLNALLWWWVFWAPIILLTLYYENQQPKTECIIKSPTSFSIGLLLIVPFSFILVLFQMWFISLLAKGGVLVQEIPYPAKIDEYYFMKELGESIAVIFSMFHVLCWFIGTILIMECME